MRLVNGDGGDGGDGGRKKNAPNSRNLNFYFEGSGQRSPTDQTRLYCRFVFITGSRFWNWLRCPSHSPNLLHVPITLVNLPRCLLIRSTFSAPTFSLAVSLDSRLWAKHTPSLSLAGSTIKYVWHNSRTFWVMSLLTLSLSSDIGLHSDPQGRLRTVQICRAASTVPQPDHGV